MSCAITPAPMAHQWRTRVCAIIIGALGKTNGAMRAPLGFAQWSANGAMALSSWTSGSKFLSRRSRGCCVGGGLSIVAYQGAASAGPENPKSARAARRVARTRLTLSPIGPAASISGHACWGLMRGLVR